MTAPANTAEKAKHTPGPWTLQRHGVIVGGKFHAYPNGVAQSQLAMVTYLNNSEAQDIEAERDANARLIAAAPELLEALAYALPYLRATVPNPRNGVNPDCTPDVNCVDRAIAAIAKATGATP